MPDRYSRWLSGWIADVAWQRRGRAVRQFEINISHVLGKSAANEDVRKVSRAAMHSRVRYLREISLLRTRAPDDIPEPVTLIGAEILEEGVLSGCGVVLALPHMANWEYAGIYLASRVGRVCAVATYSGPKFIYSSYIRTMDKFGVEVLPLDRQDRRISDSGAAHLFVALARQLRSGKVVCLLADRIVNGAGLRVGAFGEEAYLSPGPAMLALHTGAALLPATLWYEDDGWSGQVYEEIKPPRQGTRSEKVTWMTEAIARAFKQGICQHPEDWQMGDQFFGAQSPPPASASISRIKTLRRRP